ncbi:MAG TPA: replicative DNA helicase [Persephonella sp.]|nr:replicative DNA helicase [Hydrogenothermaceae bacterium]HIQ25555.1 replicative DNA helicase [Persephonella sp.]
MDETILDLPLPHDDQLERAVIGAIIIEPSVADTVLNILKPEDFYNEKNKAIYETVIEIISEGIALDPLTLKTYLEKKNKLEYIGGEIYLSLVLSDAAPPKSVEHIAQTLKEKAITRGLITVAKDILLKAKQIKNVDELIDYAESSIFKLSEEKTISEYFHIGDVLQKTLEIINELSKKDSIVTGLPSGFYELDRLTTGFHKGDLVIIAARPAMGKTSLALSIIHHVSVVENIPSAFFSLEMSKEQIAMRLLCNEARIPLRKVRSGFLTREELEVITEKVLEMKNAPIFVDDTAALSILDLRAKARKLKREKDIQLIIIDYLQLMRSSRRVENRQQEVAEISRGLKGLAKDLDIPVIALAQLSRQTEMRSDKRPQLADLRESGSIEQDADMVMFIHRPEYYKKNPTPEEKGIAEIIIAKQRNGPTGTVKLAFIKEITKFENLAKDYFQNLDDGEVPIETSQEENLHYNNEIKQEEDYDIDPEQFQLMEDDNIDI